MLEHVRFRGELPLLDVWKNALQLFVWNKHFINKKHEFAIVILNEKAQWVSGVSRYGVVTSRVGEGKKLVLAHRCLY